MNRMKEELPEDDEFEPLELGTVAEETKGQFGDPNEHPLAVNTQV